MEHRTPKPRALARSFTLPVEVDTALRAEAERQGVPYTSIVVEALRDRLRVPVLAHPGLAPGRRPSLRAVRTPEIR